MSSNDLIKWFETIIVLNIIYMSRYTLGIVKCYYYFIIIITIIVIIIIIIIIIIVIIIYFFQIVRNFQMV